MKLMFASDIHGSAYYCRKMLEAFENEKAERLILLGDILYHGPRNDLPKEYAPKEVIALLNPMKNRIYAVRGNCEAEVDQMVLDFPVMADYCVLLADGKAIYATHGHVYNEQNLPPFCEGDVFDPWSYACPESGASGRLYSFKSRLGFHPERRKYSTRMQFWRTAFLRLRGLKARS